MHDQEVHDAGSSMAMGHAALDRRGTTGDGHAAMKIRGFLEREHERGDGKWVQPGRRLGCAHES